MRAKTHWPAVLAALGAGISTGAAISKMSPALPLLQKEFGLTLIATGWLVSTFNTIALASAIFFGLLCDRAGALKFCIGGLACMVVGGVLGVLAPSAPWIIASRVAEGTGYVAVLVSAPGLIAAATAPSQRGIAFGLWGTHMPVGGVAVVLASPLLFAASGWRAVWILVAAFASLIIALLVLQARQYTGMQAGAPRSLASVRASLAQPVPWLLGIAFAAYTLQFYAVMIWLPTYLLETRATSVMASAALTALYVTANALGCLMGGWLMQRNNPRGLIISITFAVTSVLFLGIFSNTLHDGLRFACVLLYGFITGNIPPAVLSGGVRYARTPAEAGTIQGLIVQVSNIGIFAGPPLLATAVTLGGGWDAALWVILAAAAIGLAAAITIVRLEFKVPQA